MAIPNTVPPAVSALYQSWRDALPAAPAVDAVEVLLGPHPNRAFTPRLVTVAASWDEDLDAVTVDRTESGARPSITEAITVACSIYVGGGERDVEGWRSGAGELLALLDGALRQLVDDDVAARARRGFTRWLDWFTEGGSGMGVIVDFVVDLTVFS